MIWVQRNADSGRSSQLEILPPFYQVGIDFSGRIYEGVLDWEHQQLQNEVDQSVECRIRVINILIVVNLTQSQSILIIMDQTEIIISIFLKIGFNQTTIYYCAQVVFYNKHKLIRQVIIAIIIVAMSMVKALTEIVSVDIGENLVSMSVVDKENQSGIKFNERLFLFVHGVFFGYISKVKMNEEPSKINIAEAKVKIPLKNLYSVDSEGEIVIIKFTIQDDGKLIPKEWILKTASQKMAIFWKQLIDYEIKIRDKSSPPKKGASAIKKQNLNSSSSNKSPEKKQVSAVKKIEISEQINEINKQKPNIQLKKAAKVIQNPLFEDGSDSEEERTKKKNQGGPGRKLSTSSPGEILQKSKKTQQLKTQVKAEIKSQMKTESKPQIKPLIKPEPIKIEQQPLKPIIQNKRKQHTIQIQLQNIPQQPFEETPSNKNQKISKPSPNKYFQRKAQQVKKPPQPIDAGIKQSEFINTILKDLNEKNSKYPFSQLVYSHEDVAKIAKIYGKDLSEARNEKDKTEKLLRYIMESQREKMKNSFVRQKASSESPWIYKQILHDEVDNLIKFQIDCKNFMKVLYGELCNQKFNIFRKIKEQKNTLILQVDDIQVKIPLITHKQSNSKIKVMDQNAHRLIRRQFKYLKYLYRIINNEGRILVPYSCLCQYGGIVALFKVKAVVGQKQTILSEIGSELAQLQLKCKLSLQQGLAGKVKALKQYYYNELRKGDTGIHFKYCLIDQIQNALATDLNQAPLLQGKQLRLQMIEQQVKSPLSYYSKQDLQKSNRANFQDLQALSNSLKKRINETIPIFNQGQYFFVSPFQLSSFLHNRGINMRYLGQIYSKVNDVFIKSLIASQMSSRSIKIIFRKTLQDECLGKQSGKESKQDNQNLLKDLCIDFLNCIFGSGAQTNAIWQLILKNIQNKFNLKLSRQDLNKGQLLVSVAYHCNITLNWTLIDGSLLFKNNQFLHRDMIKDTYVKIKNYEPNSSKLRITIEKRIKQISQSNFTNLVNKLQLKQQKFSKQLYLYPDLISSIKVFLGNFIQPEQLDWSNNYSHLAIYDFSQFSLNALRSYICMMRWYLKGNKKAKYLSKFNEFTSKIAKVYGHHHPLLSDMYELFSEFHKSKGETEDSINFMKSSLLNYSSIFIGNNIQVARSYHKLGSLFAHFKKQYEAQEYLQKANSIIDSIQPKKTLLQGKIKLSLSLLYFKNQKYRQCLDLSINAISIFEVFQDEFYQLQRAQLYQMIYFCQARTDSKTDNIRLCAQLEKKLIYFKNHSNFAEILWIIVDFYINNLTLENKTTIKKLIKMIPTKMSIKYYKKSYELLLKRYNEKNLFQSFKKYIDNATKIVEMIIQKNLLKVWQNLQKIYQRQTLFDFISLVEELIYFLGRDRLDTI